MTYNITLQKITAYYLKIQIYYDTAIRKMRYIIHPTIDGLEEEEMIKR